MTDLSIIIVCYKGWEQLNNCLGVLDSFTGTTFKTEVIVVDNKSDDDAIYKTKTRFPKFGFIFNKINGGFANGCNLGAGNALGEFILFLNPDTVAHESEIEKLLKTAKQNPEFTLVSCRQVNKNGKENIPYGPFPSMFNLTGFQRAIFGNRMSEVRRPKSEISFPDWISGSVILIKNETFKKLGGFDEDFWMYYEDVDLCRRTRNIDGEIAFCSNITIEHNHGGSSRINLKTTSLTKTEVQISRHVYISKHKTGFEKFMIQVFLVTNNLVSGGIMALLGLVLFFIPKVFSRTVIYCRLIGYYLGSLFRLSWISPRSVNFKRGQTDAPDSTLYEFD
jgi:GT2 family glycosyltransferase